jgi:hypothetical protein
MQLHEIIFVVRAAIEAGVRLAITAGGKSVIIEGRRYNDLLSALKAIKDRTKG